MLDVLHARRLDTPSVVDEQLCLYAKETIEQILVIVLRRLAEGAACNIAHGIEAVCLELCSVALADAPEVRERAMRPERLAIAQFIQLCHTYPVRIGFHALGNDVHGDLCQVEVRPDAGGRGNAGLLQHLPDEAQGKVVCGDMQGVQIARRVDEHLVDGVDVDVRRRNMPQIDLIDAHAVCDVECHARRGNVVGDAEVRRCGELCRIRCLTREPVLRRTVFPLGVCVPHGTDDLKEARTAADAVHFERRGYGKADRFRRAAFVCDDEMRRQRIQTALDAFHRGIEGF